MDSKPPLYIRLMPRRSVSRTLGWFGRRKLPGFILRPYLRWYTRRFGADLDEARRPLEAYLSFLDFFTRRLLDGARPMPEDPAAIASPSDGRISQSGGIKDGQLLQVKGVTYSVAKLLGSETAAVPFEDGSYAVIYLAPGDYHRYHWPLDGHAHTVRHIPGDLWPVNQRSVESVKGLFARNERVVVLGDTAAGAPFAYVPVGALNVGSIKLTFHPIRTNRFRRGAVKTFEVDVSGKRGEEFGLFEFGSTVVLLLAPGAGRLDELAPGTRVLLGQSIGRVRGGQELSPTIRDT